MRLTRCKDVGDFGIQIAEHHVPALGTRASANTSGPDFTWSLEPGEIADRWSAPNEENLFLLPDRFSKSRLLEMTIQPFDLMSRRHPLSSTRAINLNLLREANRPEGSRDVPASSSRQFFRSEIYFFLATLRVFFAVFFTALFAFFAFLAFLAMLPS